MAAVMAGVDARAAWDDWERVAAPTLLVFGESGMFDAPMRAELTARARNATAVELAGGSHDAHLDAFPAWIAALRAFA